MRKLKRVSVNFSNNLITYAFFIAVHEDERPSEDIAELLQKSLTVEEEPAKNGRTIPQVKESEDSAAALVGSSDSSVEGLVVSGSFFKFSN